MRAIRALEALIVATVVAWVLGAPRLLGLSLYAEQFLAAVLGLAMALAFLKLPARGRAAKTRIPWWDWLAAAAAIGACGYVAVRYGSVVTEVSMRPRDFVALAALLVVLVMETTRRATGMSLVWYGVAGVAYALWGHLIPGAFQAQDVSFTRLANYLGLDTNALLGTSLQVAVVIVIPFLILGQLLARCGGSEFFTDLAMSLMGRYRGDSCMARAKCLASKAAMPLARSISWS